MEFLFGRKPEAVGALLAGQAGQICRGAPPAQLRECPPALAILPRVEAVPITEEGATRRLATPPAIDPVTQVPVIGLQHLVPVTRPPDAVAVARPGAGPQIVPIPGSDPKVVPLPGTDRTVVTVPEADRRIVPMPELDRKVVTIQRDEPVIIDMIHKRVLVERIER